MRQSRGALVVCTFRTVTEVDVWTLVISVRRRRLRGTAERTAVPVAADTPSGTGPTGTGLQSVGVTELVGR